MSLFDTRLSCKEIRKIVIALNSESNDDPLIHIMIDKQNILQKKQNDLVIKKSGTFFESNGISSIKNININIDPNLWDTNPNFILGSIKTF